MCIYWAKRQSREFRFGKYSLIIYNILLLLYTYLYKWYDDKSIKYEHEVSHLFFTYIYFDYAWLFSYMRNEIGKNVDLTL